MGNRGIGNFRLLNGLAIEACLALFPCNLRSDSATAWAWLKTLACEESRPLARAGRKAETLSGQGLATAAAEEERKGGDPTTAIHQAIKFVDLF